MNVRSSGFLNHITPFLALADKYQLTVATAQRPIRPMDVEDLLIGQLDEINKMTTEQRNAYIDEAYSNCHVGKTQSSQCISRLDVIGRCFSHSSFYDVYNLKFLGVDVDKVNNLGFVIRAKAALLNAGFETKAADIPPFNEIMASVAKSSNLREKPLTIKEFEAVCNNLLDIFRKVPRSYDVADRIRQQRDDVIRRYRRFQDIMDDDEAILEYMNNRHHDFDYLYNVIASNNPHYSITAGLYGSAAMTVHAKLIGTLLDIKSNKAPCSINHPKEVIVYLLSNNDRDGVLTNLFRSDYNKNRFTEFDGTVDDAINMVTELLKAGMDGTVSANDWHVLYRDKQHHTDSISF